MLNHFPGLSSAGRSLVSRAKWLSSSSRLWSRRGGRGRWWRRGTSSTWMMTRRYARTQLASSTPALGFWGLCVSSSSKYCGRSPLISPAAAENGGLGQSCYPAATFNYLTTSSAHVPLSLYEPRVRFRKKMSLRGAVCVCATKCPLRANTWPRCFQTQCSVSTLWPLSVTANQKSAGWECRLQLP